METEIKKEITSILMILFRRFLVSSDENRQAKYNVVLEKECIQKMAQLIVKLVGKGTIKK